MGDRAAGYLHAAIDAWRRGSPRSQTLAALAMLSIIGASFVVSVTASRWMPLAAYFVWLLIAMMLLRFRPLVLVGAADAVAGVVALAIGGPLTGPRLVAMAAFALAVLLVLVVASRQRSGLPAMLSEAFLVDLRDRLQTQGRIPPLPEGWHSQSAMIAAHGGSYAGDFLVSALREDGRQLDLILVDVCGKGIDAGPAALQFAGALGGLIGTLPPRELFHAANHFLIRQPDDEAFATAVHLRLNLEDGSYQIASGGHPPALRWDLTSRTWLIDNARGTALGVLPSPELHLSEGRLLPGEALLFYTDGVVESRDSDIDAGIAWLQGAALEASRHGFEGAARRIIARVESGDDDRAVLILSRTAVGSQVANQSTAVGDV